jgi:hypothetical protein
MPIHFLALCMDAIVMCRCVSSLILLLVLSDALCSVGLYVCYYVFLFIFLAFGGSVLPCIWLLHISIVSQAPKFCLTPL